MNWYENIANIMFIYKDRYGLTDRTIKEILIEVIKDHNDALLIRAKSLQSAKTI